MASPRNLPAFVLSTGVEQRLLQSLIPYPILNVKKGGNELADVFGCEMTHTCCGSAAVEGDELSSSIFLTSELLFYLHKRRLFYWTDVNVFKIIAGVIFLLRVSRTLIPSVASRCYCLVFDSLAEKQTSRLITFIFVSMVQHCFSLILLLRKRPPPPLHGRFFFLSGNCLISQ